jgi:hypothetical protein
MRIVSAERLTHLLHAVPEAPRIVQWQRGDTLDFDAGAR